jgi:hypothetical protein
MTELTALARLFGPRVPLGASAADRTTVLDNHRELRLALAQLNDSQLANALRDAQALGDVDQAKGIAYQAILRGNLGLANAAAEIVDPTGADEDNWNAAWLEAQGVHEDPMMAEIKATLSGINEAEARDVGVGTPPTQAEADRLEDVFQAAAARAAAGLTGPTNDGAPR